MYKSRDIFNELYYNDMCSLIIKELKNLNFSYIDISNMCK
jgi:hypothetical protein